MPVNYGTTLAYPVTRGDILPDLRPVTGIDALIESLYRRFETREGTLKWDRNAGYCLVDLLLDNEPDPAAIRARVEAECRKDDRVDEVTAVVVWNRRTRTLTIDVEGKGGLGPFKFVVRTSEVSMELLKG